MSIADDILNKATLPTHLSSEAIRYTWSQQLKEQSIFSAKTIQKPYLETVKSVLQSIADGDIATGEARADMAAKLASLGVDLTLTEGEPNPVIRMKDIASKIRMDLIIKTNVGTANSLAMQATQANPVAKIMYPAYELISGEYRQTHRPWAKIWRESASRVNFNGVAQGTNRMIALTQSPIWAILGQSKDGLGNPYPPFRFNSSYNWVRISRAECIELGLIAE